MTDPRRRLSLWKGVEATAQARADSAIADLEEARRKRIIAEQEARPIAPMLLNMGGEA